MKLLFHTRQLLFDQGIYIACFNQKGLSSIVLLAVRFSTNKNGQEICQKALTLTALRDLMTKQKELMVV